MDEDEDTGPSSLVHWLVLSPSSRSNMTSLTLLSPVEASKRVRLDIADLNADCELGDSLINVDAQSKRTAGDMVDVDDSKSKITLTKRDLTIVESEFILDRDKTKRQNPSPNRLTSSAWVVKKWMA